MNEKDNFIIEDLDDHHLVIKADEEFRVRKELEIEVRATELCQYAPHWFSAGEEHLFLGIVI